MSDRFPFTHNDYSRQAAITAEYSDTAVQESSEAVDTTRTSLHSIHVALSKSFDAILASRRLLDEQAWASAAWKNRGF